MAARKIIAARRLSAQDDLKELLDRKVQEFNRPEFIAGDPVSIPHRFTKKQDIEIAGLFAATFAWGQRTTIIRKSLELMERMDNDPHAFCRDHSEADRRALTFRHRTFNDTDLAYFLRFLQHHYRRHDSLEPLFSTRGPLAGRTERGLDRFSEAFFALDDAPARTRKHVAAPSRGSTCKRLNMFLRWMVRRDRRGVDFGLWRSISPAALICPLDVHVSRTARQFGLITRRNDDWETAVELTENLRLLDPDDPVKYDFALFGLGVSGDVAEPTR